MTGVPQGWVLDLLLFTASINDISLKLQRFSLVYTGDCILFASVNDFIEKLNNWYVKNRLFLNINKYSFKKN